MKTLLFFIGIFLFCSVVIAQQSTLTKSPLRIKTNCVAANKPHKVVKKTAGGIHETSIQNLSGMKSPVHEGTRTEHRNGTVKSSSLPTVIPESIIGYTTYDLQTNGTISNRLVNANGNLSATWMMSLTGSTATQWPDRGTGYNFSSDGGTTWFPYPTNRVEPFRTGFPSIGYAGFNEAILTHTTSLGSSGIVSSLRATQGSGSWISDSIPGLATAFSWPKLIAGGADGHSFHAIWQGTGTDTGPLYYSRSTDDGITWSPKTELPGYIWGTDIFALGADCYSIDARGDEIAIVAGEFGADVTLLKSTDNGVTWTKRIIDQYPIPLYDGNSMNTDTNFDGIADTLWTGVGDATVLIDNNNLIHIFYGRTRSVEEPGGLSLAYYFTPAIYYWREDWADNAPLLLATPPDLNGDSVLSLPIGCSGDPSANPMGYYGTGLVAYIEMPSASVDASNTIYLSYQAVDELSDTTIYEQMFMHPYIIKSIDGGDHWTNPDSAYDVVLASQAADGESYDGAFACISRTADSFVHMIYQRDFSPGTTLSGSIDFPCESANNADNPNDIVYVGIQVSDVLTGSWRPGGTVDVPTINNPSFSITPNYPNPFRGKTSVDINLKKTSDVTVEISDLLGQVLSVQKYPNFSTGMHKLTIDATTFASGVYTYKISTGKDAVTKKMIVQ